MLPQRIPPWSYRSLPRKRCLTGPMQRVVNAVSQSVAPAKGPAHASMFHPSWVRTAQSCRWKALINHATVSSERRRVNAGIAFHGSSAPQRRARVQIYTLDGRRVAVEMVGAEQPCARIYGAISIGARTDTRHRSVEHSARLGPFAMVMGVAAEGKTARSPTRVAPGNASLPAPVTPRLDER